MVKFVHCADIHLGANPFEIEERFEDMGKAFSQVCKFAIKEKVDFVLIAGDFFHNKTVNPRTLEQALEELEKLKKANIPVFLTEGNHDMSSYTHVYSWLQFLSSRKDIILLKTVKNDKLLNFWNGKEGAIYEHNKAYIIGLGYPGSTASKYIQKITDELKQLIKDNKFINKPIICMLHSGINRFVTESMGGLKEEEIEGLTNIINYLALGHIHVRYENVDKKYFNPGSVECVRITDNPFNKGFYFVKLEENKLETEFKLVKNRNSLSLSIDIPNEEINIYDYILEIIKKEYEEKCEKNQKIMLQIKINGIAKSGTMEINIQELKKIIKNEIPVLYQDIMNLIIYVDEQEIKISEDVSREEIDKIVVKEKIEKAGYKKDEIDDIYNIITLLKECAGNGNITIDDNNGKDIENMLLNISRGG